MGARLSLTRVKIVETQGSTSTAPATPAVDPAAAPPPATEPPPAAAPSPVAAPEPEATPAATEEVTPAETPLTWTTIEDATLIGLKALDKTWKEIGAIMTDKPTEDLRERYDQLNITIVKADEAESKESKPTPSKAKDNEVGETSDEHTDKEKEQGKKSKKKKDKVVSDESNEKKAKAMEAKAKEEASKGTTDNTNEKPLKGILKKGKGSQKKRPVNYDPIQRQDRPIFYIDGGDALDRTGVGIP